MSVQEASQRSTSPSPLKPEPKPRPEIPPKPSPQTGSPPLGDRGGSPSEGKVKRIVNKFSKKEFVPSDPAGQPTNGTAKFTPNKRLKRPPTIKPKPGRASRQLQTGGEQAPPLPLKRRTLQKQKERDGGEEGDSVSVEGGRSGTVVFNFHFYPELWRSFCLGFYVDFMFLAIDCCCHLYFPVSCVSNALITVKLKVKFR